MWRKWSYSNIFGQKKNNNNNSSIYRNLTHFEFVRALRIKEFYSTIFVNRIKNSHQHIIISSDRGENGHSAVAQKKKKQTHRATNSNMCSFFFGQNKQTHDSANVHGASNARTELRCHYNCIYFCSVEVKHRIKYWAGTNTRAHTMWKQMKY